MRWAAWSGASQTMVMRETSVALGLAYGERDDVDVETAEERGDSREDAGLVLDQGYEGVEHEYLQ